MSKMYIQLLASAQASSEPRNPPPMIAISLHLELQTFSLRSRKSSFVLNVIILSFTSFSADSNIGRFFGDAPAPKYDLIIRIADKNLISTLS